MSTVKKITNDQLKTIMSDALVPRINMSSNLSDFTTNGLYSLDLSKTGGPTGVSLQGAILKVMKWDKNRVYQVLYSTSGTFTRVCDGGQWKDWQKIATTVVPS